MKVLVVVATELEGRLLADELNFECEIEKNRSRYWFDDLVIDILSTGVGVIFTTFHLTRTLLKYQYEIVLNIGLGRSFSKKIEIGEVLNIVTEEFADLGIEKYSGFKSLFDLGYLPKNEFPFEKGIINNSTVSTNLGLPIAKGITVNKTYGRSSMLEELSSKFDAEVESMEGAAIFYVCKNISVPFLELRAISNYVEPREFSNWNIPLALSNLNIAVFQVLSKLNVVVT